VEAIMKMMTSHILETGMTYEVIAKRKRKTIQVRNPMDIYKAVKRYGREEREHLLVLTLNGAHEIITVHIASIGLVNKTVVHPREIFRNVYMDNAVAMVVAHNHPSGALVPSGEDMEITEQIHEASKVLGINFMDHLIINKDNFYSFRGNGKMPE
jgi:DNA repair protein RadC